MARLVEIYPDTWVNVAEGAVSMVQDQDGFVRVYFVNSNAVTCPIGTTIEDIVDKINGPSRFRIDLANETADMNIAESYTTMADKAIKEMKSYQGTETQDD